MLYPYFPFIFPLEKPLLIRPQIKLAPFQYSVQSRKQKEQSQQMNCESIS